MPIERNIQHLRGPRSALDVLAGAGDLKPGQIYVITDEDRIAVALTTSTYERFAKVSEAGGGGGAADPLDLTTSAPATPPADTIRLFRRSVAGRQMLGQIGPSGLDTTFLPHVGRNAIAAWLPAGNGTTVELARSVGLTATGTATAANVATTNRHTLMKRLDYLVTTAATNAVAGFRSSAPQWLRGVNAGDGGFHFICRWGPATGVSVSTTRCFVGMQGVTSVPTDVNPSTLTSIVGMGWDSGDTNMQMMTNDGSGAATKIDLGASFPRPSADRTKVYELAMFAPPAGSTIGWRVEDLATGAVAEGTISTDLPPAATLLAPRGWMSVGGTSSVIGIALMGLTIESDY